MFIIPRILFYVSASDTVKVELTCELPSGVAGAMIRKSTTGYPTTETEGDLVKNITADGTYTDTDVTVGVVYYHSAFAYTSTGAYNRAEANPASVTPKASINEETTFLPRSAFCLISKSLIL